MDRPQGSGFKSHQAGGVRPVGGAAVGCSPFASAIRHTCDPQGAAAGRVGGVAGAAVGAGSRAALPGVQKRPHYKDGTFTPASRQLHMGISQFPMIPKTFNRSVNHK